MRQHGRGKRWLQLRRWNTVRGSKRAQLRALFAANRRLFKAYVLREQLDRLWTYKTRTGVLTFLNGWIDALRWERLPEMDRLGEFLRPFVSVASVVAIVEIVVPVANARLSVTVCWRRVRRL
jgi:transposase